MINFKDTKKMDAEELRAYVEAPHSEISGQAEELRKIKAGDTFVRSDVFIA